MPNVRARIDLARVAEHTINPKALTPPRVESVAEMLRNRGLVNARDGWWEGEDAVIRSLGDAVLEVDPPDDNLPADGHLTS